jgi:TetR/AcrR family transcriptional regulator, regulator of mycofactocin system
MTASRSPTVAWTDGRTELAAESLAAQLRTKRSEMMISELEVVALRLFEARGFAGVTVEEIALEAQISPRTFYRYFPAKEDVLQLRIDRRSEALRVALSIRPADEPPLHSLRRALEEALSKEDTELLRRWIAVVAATPSVLQGVLGGIQLKGQRVIAEFFGSRLGQPSETLVPTMLAAAAGGVVQAAQTHWYFQGGDLAAAVSMGLEILENGIGTDPRSWKADMKQPKPSPRRH